MAILPGEPQFPFDSSSPYILFNTIPPCPSETGEGKRSREKVRSVRGSWCRDFEAGCSSCWCIMLNTSTHPFFNYQQTPEGRDVASFYIQTQKRKLMSVSWHCVCVCVLLSRRWSCSDKTNTQRNDVPGRHHVGEMSSGQYSVVGCIGRVGGWLLVFWGFITVPLFNIRKNCSRYIDLHAYPSDSVNTQQVTKI